MCDYSLQGMNNRLATDGEELVLHRFDTGTVGMIAADALPPSPTAEAEGWWETMKAWWRESIRTEPCAVCIPPGARLILCDIPVRVQQQLHVGAEEEVTFTQTTPDAYRYRDAVRFRNGREVSLQRLQPGQRVHVLSLAMAEETSRRRRSDVLQVAP